MPIRELWHLDASVQAPALNGEGESTGPSSDFLAELVDARNLAAGNLGLEVLELVGFLGKSSLDLLADLDALIDVFGDTLKVLLAETTAAHGRGTNADAAWGESALVSRNGVLVAGNVDLLKNSLDTGTVQAELTEVKENHVAISAISNQLVAKRLECVFQSLGVGYDLLLVGLELGGLSLLESNGQGGDGVIMRSTLMAGEDGEVDGALKVIEGLLASFGIDRADTLAEEDHCAARATERLVGGGSDDISVLERRRDDFGSDKSRDVSHVDNKVSANGVGDLTHALIVNQAAVSRGTGDEDLGAVENSVLGEHVVVDDASLEVNSVRHSLEVGGDSRDPGGENKQVRTRSFP